MDLKFGHNLPPKKSIIMCINTHNNYPSQRFGFLRVYRFILVTICIPKAENIMFPNSEYSLII
jgi:hypothetical protein